MRHQRKIGIKEVAASAGVSITTVSHALNGKGRLPQRTRDRIAKIAEELGYSPSVSARAVSAGKTGVLGLAVSQLGTPTSAMTDFAYYAQLTMAATQEALKHGHALVLTPADGVATPRDIVAIDGAIIVDPVRDDPFVTDLRAANVPVVTTGRTLGAEADDCWVDNDNVTGAGAVLDHLARQGARRPALLTTSADISYTVDVSEAYHAWCERHAIPPIVESTERSATEPAALAAAARLLELDDRPDAIFASYDRLALGALLAAESRGVRIPDDLLLATVGTGSRRATATTPSLTTLDFNPEVLGRQAAALLIKLVRGDTNAERPILVPHRLVTRASTKRSGSRVVRSAS